jgi:hypothetical protein
MDCGFGKVIQPLRDLLEKYSVRLSRCAARLQTSVCRAVCTIAGSGAIIRKIASRLGYRRRGIVGTRNKLDRSVRGESPRILVRRKMINQKRAAQVA